MKEVEEYLETKIEKKGTRKIYRRDLEQFRIYVEKDVKEVEEEDFLRYFHEISERLKVASVRRKQSVLRQFYQYLLSERKISKNPFPVIKSNVGQQRKKEEKERLSEQEYEILLKDMSEEMQLLTKTLWETGAKILDLYDVTVQSLYDYQFEKIVGKRQGKVYSYFLPQELAEEFRKQVEGKEREKPFFSGNRQQYDKELKKRNPQWNASKIKKELWQKEKIDIEKVREHYFEIGIGDR